MWQSLKKSSDWHYVGLVILFMTLPQLIGSEHFRYQRDWSSSGEVWRLLSAHWVHVGWTHWFLNCVSLVILVSLTAPQWSIKSWLIVTTIIALGISLLFTYFNPDLVAYVGHSGVIYGLFMLASFSLFRRDRLVASLIVAAIAIKLVMEQTGWFDFNSSSLIEAPVEVDAHLYGALIAIAIALIKSRYTIKNWFFGGQH